MVPGNPFDDDGADPDETIRVVRAAAPELGRTGHAMPAAPSPPVHPTGRPTIPTSNAQRRISERRHADSRQQRNGGTPPE